MSPVSPLPALAQAEIASWLVDKLSHELDGIRVDRDRPMAEYGLSSITATSLIGDAEEWLHIEIDPTAFFDYLGSTKDALSRSLWISTMPSITLKYDSTTRRWCWMRSKATDRPDICPYCFPLPRDSCSSPP